MILWHFDVFQRFFFDFRPIFSSKSCFRGVFPAFSRVQNSAKHPENTPRTHHTADQALKIPNFKWRAAAAKPLAAARPRSAFAFHSPARALTADLPRQDLVYITTEELFRFVSTTMNSMKCLVNWIPLRIRFRLRNTQPHLQIKYACVRHTNLDVVAAKESSNGVETLPS